MAHRGGRVIGADALRISALFRVSRDGQEREQGSEGYSKCSCASGQASDARNRARCAGLIFTDPDDAVTQREPTSQCSIHDDAPRV